MEKPVPSSDKIVSECIHKLAQMVARTRVLKARQAEPGPVNKWFNLQLPEVAWVREQVVLRKGRYRLSPRP